MSNKYPGGLITSGANAGYSVAFDGTGDQLTIGNNTAFDFGSGNFTIEFWMYLTGSSGSIINYSNGQSTNSNFAWEIYQTNTTSLQGSVFSGASGYSTTSAYTLNAWNHVALVRNGNALTVYVNGVAGASPANVTGVTVSNPASSTVKISGYNNATGFITGYMSNVRVIKGTALYTAAFTPPTQLLAITNTSLLTCNSPAIVDQSSNNFTITANGNAAASTFTPFTGTQLVPNPNTLANTQGVWSISDAAYWMSQNKWPMPPNYPLQSLRFNSADTAYLNRTPASAGNRRVWTWSCWFKFGLISNANYRSFIEAFTGSTDVYNTIAYENGVIKVNQDNGAGGVMLVSTPAVFRDPGAWYHLVVAVDTTQATGTNRVKLWINGVQQTLTFSVTPAQNLDTWVNSVNVHRLGARWGTVSSVSCFDGYMADVNFVDGQALTPSSFGANDPNTGVWSPVPYSGTYGTNGFRLSFQDNTGTTATTLGKDYSGNGNNWTPNNFSVAAGSGNDSLTDGPTNWGIDYGNGGEVRGNYATLNPLKIFSANFNFSNGNLDATDSGASNVSAIATMSLPTSGKWYFEATAVAQPSSGALAVGVTNEATATGTSAATFAGAYRSNGVIYNLANVTQTSGAAYVANDIIGIAVDVDAGTVKFYKNGVGQGDTPSYSFTAGTVVYPFVAGDNVSGAKSWSMNFGQRPFAYPAPSGFKVLCTTNLPIPTVGATSATLASRYMDVLLYTGNGSSRSITGLNFQPDFVWIKSRSSASWWHQLQDAVRGATKRLASNENVAEATDATTLTSFNSDGFSLGTSTSYNNNTDTYVAWNWNAGGSTVTNTSGAISSQVRANQTAGISVVTYTGTGANATVGHGLGVAPRMMIFKNRSSAIEWQVYHASIGNGQYGVLNSTAAFASSGIWQNTTPTSTVFSIGNFSGVNTNGNNYVAYCFAEIAGFSRFGSYTGNGSADGPFIFTGFRPRFVLIKSSSDGTAGNDWVIIDTARNTFNESAKFLRPNLSNAEGDDAGTSPAISIDILSNGFKVRGTSARINTSSSTYIFAVFAEAPFNYSRAR